MKPDTTKNCILLIQLNFILFFKESAMEVLRVSSDMRKEEIGSTDMTWERMAISWPWYNNEEFVSVYFIYKCDTIDFEVTRLAIGRPKVCITRLTQCTNTILNFASLIAHLLAAYYSNTIFTSLVKPTS